MNALTTIQALPPEGVRGWQTRFELPIRQRKGRCSDAFLRQGEWYFLPMPADLNVDPRVILTDEPLRRGRGKPSMVDELVRMGGTKVYVSRRYPDGLLEHEYQALIQREPERKQDRWGVMRRSSRVLVRGKIRHEDHKTIVLPHWHRVLMNTETEAAAMRNVSFLD